MKDPREWTAADLLALPVGEFDWLEVKGRRGLDLTVPNVNEADVRENVSRAVSAFANSGGGTLVFGLKNPTGLQAWEVDDGGVNTRIRRPNTREWLEDIVPNLVDPPLTAFNVYAIGKSPAEPSNILDERAVYVVEVQDSEAAPHQATDNRYYARVAGKSRPIGHRLVADIFGRRRNPRIELSLSVANRREGDYVLAIRATNTGKVLAQYVNCFVYVPALIVSQEVLGSAERVIIAGIDHLVCRFQNINQVDQFSPILPGLSHTWAQELISNFQGMQAAASPSAAISWEAYADNALPTAGAMRIADLPVSRRTLVA